jgi:hypothetical protein
MRYISTLLTEWNGSKKNLDVVSLSEWILIYPGLKFIILKQMHQKNTEKRKQLSKSNIFLDCDITISIAY